jgi:hypothetical protein
MVPGGNGRATVADIPEKKCVRARGFQSNITPDPAVVVAPAQFSVPEKLYWGAICLDRGACPLRSVELRMGFEG